MLRKRFGAGAAALTATLVAAVGFATVQNAQASSLPTVRIDSGATTSYTDKAGRVWSADSNYLAGYGGVSSVNPVGTAIGNTTDAKLYETERWGLTGYGIPVPNGTYSVRLRFAEINPSSGRRAFNVSLNNQRVLTNFSPGDEAGSYKALDKTFTTSVKSGVLLIGFDAIAGQNLPSIAAVEVSGASTTSTSSSVASKPGQRFDAGSSTGYVDAAGNAWLADAHFDGGYSNGVVPAGTPVTQTNNPRAYQTERWGVRGYNVPVANGTQTVTLKFAELNPASGRRAFHVDIEGVRVLTNFSPAEAAGGPYRAIDKQFVTAVKDGVVNITFTGITGQNVPSINAIEVTAGGTLPATSVPPTNTTPPTSTTPSTVTPPVTTPGGAVPVGVGGSWTQIFSDEFNGSTLDAGRWVDHEPWEAAGRKANVAWLPVPATKNQVEVANGALSLKARRGAGLPEGATFTSAELSTRGKFIIPDNVTSYTEARLKPPTGNALWPAFWLLGNGDNSTGEGWPINGEVDILEFVNNPGERGRPYASLWYPKDVYTKPPGTWLNATHVTHKDSMAPRPELLGSYHTWGLFRSPDKMEVYIDGKLLATYLPGQTYGYDNIPLPKMLFTKSQHVRLSLAVGGNWAGAGLTEAQYQEGNLDVDYVRVWKR